MNELTLADRVTVFVAANPGLTLAEIARGVRARTQSVLEVLSSEAFSASPRDAYSADRAQVYRVASEAGEQPGTAARPTQCARIAAVLEDGQWHTTGEIHERCGYSRLNSRIAEMRNPAKRWRMVIECRHVPGKGTGPAAYEYRLVGRLDDLQGTSEAADGVRGRSPSAASGVSAVSTHSPESVTVPALAAETPDQLSIGAEAA